ncbi:DISARM system phospholipase D-like protein DrmC [Actinophytocola glycyrrhizae]|uniref:DISARM system phospholipase D-like protein DrmC n=1 Tax=Actinophytocola glycyrrhizae TaxID=2044873 RepID=A0ABV9RZ78_9PSEU
MNTQRLGAELAVLAGRLSSGQVRSWCAVLDGAPSPHSAVEAELIDTHAGSGVTAAAGQLMTLWRRHAPGLHGSAVSLALSAAATVHEDAERDRPRLVVTGPTTSAVAVRLTSSVVVDIVRAATERVLLVSFAAHGVAEVVRELEAAVARGVEVDLVLETTEDSGGRLRGGPGSGAFSALADRAALWHWPVENRRRSGAALHAKVLVADAAVALLSSANFTDRGMADNIEVGVLLRDVDTAGRLDRHFRSLMKEHARCLGRVPR